MKKEGEIEGEGPEIIGLEDGKSGDSEPAEEPDTRARITAQLEEWKEQRLREIAARLTHNAKILKEIFGGPLESRRFGESDIGTISERQKRKDYALDIANANAAAREIYEAMSDRIEAAKRGEATQLSDVELDAMVKEAIAAADAGLKEEETKAQPLKRLINRRKERRRSRGNAAQGEEPKDPEQSTSQEAHTKENTSSEGQEETEQVDMTELRTKLLESVKELFNTIVSLMDDPKTGLNVFAKVIIRDSRLRQQVATHLQANNAIACQLTEQAIQQLTKDAPIECAGKNMEALQELLVSLTDRVDEIGNSNAAAADRTQKDRSGQYNPTSATQSLMKVISTIYESVIGDILHVSCSDEEKPGGMRVQRRDLRKATRNFFDTWVTTSNEPLPNEYHPQLKDLIDFQIPNGGVSDFADLVNQVIHRHLGMGEELKTALDNILGKDTRTEDKDDKNKKQEEPANRPDLGDMIDAIVLETSIPAETNLFAVVQKKIETESDPNIRRDLELLFGKMLRLKEDRGRGYRRKGIDPEVVRKAWEEIASPESCQKHPPHALTHEAALMSIESYVQNPLTGNVFWKGLHFLEILYDASRDGNFVIPLNDIILRTAEILAYYPSLHPLTFGEIVTEKSFSHYTNLSPLTFDEIITAILSRDRRLEMYLSEHGLGKERILNEIAMRQARGIRPVAIPLNAETARMSLLNETTEILANSKENERKGDYFLWKIHTAQEAYDELQYLAELINRTTSTYGYTTIPEVQKILDEITELLQESAADQGTTRSELLEVVNTLKSQWAVVLPRFGIGPADLVCRQLLNNGIKPNSNPGQGFRQYLETTGAKTALRVFNHVEWIAKKMRYPLEDSDFTPQQIKDIVAALKLYRQLVIADGPVSQATIEEIKQLIGTKGVWERFLDEFGLGDFEETYSEKILRLALSAQTWQERLSLAEYLLTHATAEKHAVPRSLVPSLKVDMRAPLEFLVASTLHNACNIVTDSLRSGDLSKLMNLGRDLPAYLEWLRAMDIMPPTFDFDSSLANFMFNMSQHPDAMPRIPKSLQTKVLDSADPFSLFSTALKSTGAEHSNLLDQLRTLCTDPTISIPPFIRQYLIERDSTMPKCIATPKRGSSDSTDSSDEENSPDISSPDSDPDDPDSDSGGIGGSDELKTKLGEIVAGTLAGFQTLGDLAIDGVESLIRAGKVVGIALTSEDAVRIIMRVGSAGAAVGRGGLVAGAVLVGGPLAAVVLGGFNLGKFTVRVVFGKTSGDDESGSSSKSSGDKGGSSGGRGVLNLGQMFSNELLDQQTLGIDDPEGVKAKKQELIVRAQSLGLSVRATQSAASIIASIEDRLRQLKIKAEMQANHQQFLEEEERKKAEKEARKAKAEAEMAENYRQFQEEAEEKQRKQEEKQRQKEEERKARRAAQGAFEEKPEEGKPSGGITAGQVVSGGLGALGSIMVFVGGQALRGAGSIASMVGDLASAATTGVQGSTQPPSSPPPVTTQDSPAVSQSDESPYVDDGLTGSSSSEDRPTKQTQQPAPTPQRPPMKSEEGRVIVPSLSAEETSSELPPLRFEIPRSALTDQIEKVLAGESTPPDTSFPGQTASEPSTGQVISGSSELEHAFKVWRTNDETSGVYDALRAVEQAEQGGRFLTEAQIDTITRFVAENSDEFDDDV